MAVLGERLLEIVAAALLAGAIFVFYNGIANGQWDYGMFLIVPLSFMYSMALSAMAAANLSMGLFLLLLALVIMAVYFIARFAQKRWFRITMITSTFLVQVSAMIVLSAMLQVNPT
ncbi:MAG: hypothetical protein ACO1OG_02605 [Devosia sp.]